MVPGVTPKQPLSAPLDCKTRYGGGWERWVVIVIPAHDRVSKMRGVGDNKGWSSRFSLSLSWQIFPSRMHGDIRPLSNEGRIEYISCNLKGTTSADADNNA